jgi:2-iminoacetate synthase ThiH
MIVHISMGKYKDFADGHTKEENIQRVKELTEALADKVPYVNKVEVGVNLLHHGPNDLDAVAYSEYDDLEAAQKTVAHPAHDELVALLKQVVEVSYSVTYEVDR